MFVKTLHLQRLRSFEDATINFSRNINIITGHNNSGKSSIIKALYKLQDINVMRSEDIRVQRNSAEIQIEVSDIDKESNDKYFNGRHPLQSALSECFITFRIRKTDQDKRFSQRQPDDPRAHSVDPETGDQVEELLTKDFFGFPSSEDENNYIYPFFAKRKMGGFGSPASKKDTYSVIDNFQNLPAKVLKASTQYVTKDKYDKLCNDILGFTVNAIPSEANGHTVGFYSGYNSSISLDSMGEGVANILGLITILLTENNKLFLIEELENDIHPTALKKLLNLIIEKAEKNQFIISTHSNIVLKHLGSLAHSKIFYTEYDPNEIGGSNTPTSKITEIQNSPEERMRVLELLGYDLFDFDICKGYIIFEESSAEAIINEFIIPMFFPEALFKVRTIAAQGASDLGPKFNDLHRLFLYLHKSAVYINRSWVIADGDEAGKNATEKLREKFSSWPPHFFLNFEKENFEEYYPICFQNQVQEVLAIKSSEEKRDKKRDLLISVKRWMSENRDDAKLALAESAKEVIDMLKLIIDKI
jgi:predicted ATPase